MNESNILMKNIYNNELFHKTLVMFYPHYAMVKSNKKQSSKL